MPDTHMCAMRTVALMETLTATQPWPLFLALWFIVQSFLILLLIYDIMNVRETLPEYTLKSCECSKCVLLISTQTNKKSHCKPTGSDVPSGRLMWGVTAAPETATRRAKPQLSPSRGCYTHILKLYKFPSIHLSIHASIHPCVNLPNPQTSFAGNDLLKCWPPTQLWVAVESPFLKICGVSLTGQRSVGKPLAWGREGGSCHWWDRLH